MDKFIGYRCSLCNAEYLPGQVTYTCPKDGGNLDVVLDYDAIRQKFQPEDLTYRSEDSLWRYLPLLPVPDPGGEGDSHPVRRLDTGLSTGAPGAGTGSGASLAQG